MEDCGLGIVPAVAFGLFEFPGVAAFVVEEARVVVAFVEVLKDGGEDLGEFFGEADSFGGRFEELAAADGGEEGGVGQDVFMGGEEAFFRADADSNNGRG